MPVLTLLGQPEPSYLAKPKHPIREVLKQMCLRAPPSFVKGYDFTNLTDLEIMRLQDWASRYVQPSWLTGIGVLDAAEKQVEEAVANGNIPPNPRKMPTPEPVGLPGAKGVCFIEFTENNTKALVHYTDGTAEPALVQGKDHEA